MSFNIKTIGSTFKINYSGGKFRPVNVNKFPNKTSLLFLDRIYNGQPFVNVVSKFQDTRGLETTYLGQPFYGHTDAISIPTSRISTVNHPDVNNWLNTISFNGGSASNSTIAALNAFCNTINNAGLRDKFYRLNLFCGNNLNSCLVPLYSSPSTTGLALGFNIDTSVNFASTDYTETGSNGGLNGNGTNSYINTGIDASLLPISTLGIHMGAYIRSNSITSVATKSVVGIVSDTNSNYYIAIVTTNPEAFSSSTFGSYSSSLSVIYPSLYLGSILGTNVNGILRIGLNSFSSLDLRTSGNISVKETILVMARNSGNNSNGQHWGGRVAGYTIGKHLTSSESATLNTAINTFQAALNRNI